MNCSALYIIFFPNNSLFYFTAVLAWHPPPIAYLSRDFWQALRSEVPSKVWILILNSTPNSAHELAGLLAHHAFFHWRLITSTRAARRLSVALQQSDSISANMLIVSAMQLKFAKALSCQTVTFSISLSSMMIIMDGKKKKNPIQSDWLPVHGGAINSN